jgi:uracil-DNA glycosylase
MQRDQWKTASEQLLKHWHRSGITQIPANTPLADQKSSAWLEEHASILYECLETAPTHPSMAVPDSSAAPAMSSAPPATSHPDASRVEKTNAKGSPQPAPVRSAESMTQSEAALESSSATAVVAERTQEWNSSSLSTAERTSLLSTLNDQVVACRKCDDIVCKRQRTVFGVGSVQARVAMFGEAPGADEDRVGEPFVGAAGQLLDKILIASGLNRADVYILNALKCRPPNNRTPTDEEIENCRPFFESQLEAIQPEYVVCWGAVAVRAVLRSTESVGRLRGRFHSFRGAKVMVTYHPAYLLRNPDAKRLTWDDMKMLIKDMGLQIPGKS